MSTAASENAADPERLLSGSFNPRLREFSLELRHHPEIGCCYPLPRRTRLLTDAASSGENHFHG